MRPVGRAQRRLTVSFLHVAKGYLGKRREGRDKICFSRAQPSHVERNVVDHLLQRMFDGQAMLLFQPIIQHRGPTDEEIEQPRQTQS